MEIKTNKRILSDETRLKMRKAQLGKKLPLEQRIKMSIAHKGKNTWTKGKKVSEVTRRKISQYQKNHRNHLWKGGISHKNHIVRNSLEYRLWREAVFARDNWTCIWCLTRSKKGKSVTLNADHIKPFAHYPELRFAIDNGRTLCLECHKKTDTFGVKGWHKQA